MSEKKFRIENCIASYPYVMEPNEDNDGKYTIDMLCNVKKHRVLIKNLKAEALLVAEKRWGKVPPKLKLSFIEENVEKFVHEDDNEQKGFVAGEFKDGYDEQTVLISANNKQRPVVTDRDPSVILTNKGDVKGGYKINGSIHLYAWEYKNRKGVSANIRAVQVVDNTMPLLGSGAGSVDAASEFDDISDELEDEEDDGLGDD